MIFRTDNKIVVFIVYIFPPFVPILGYGTLVGGIRNDSLHLPKVRFESVVERMKDRAV